MYSRLLLVIMSTAFVEQAVITVARITTTYRAVELDLSIVWIGIITATYAVLPIAIGIPMGRYIDRGYDAVTTWIGGGLLVVGCAGFVLFPNLIGIMAATGIIGVAHLLFVVSQQIQCTRCGTGPGAMEHAIGNYMVANAVGQGVGPLYRRARRRLSQRSAYAIAVCPVSRRRGADRRARSSDAIVRRA